MRSFYGPVLSVIRPLWHSFASFLLRGSCAGCDKDQSDQPASSTTGETKVKLRFRHSPTHAHCQNSVFYTVPLWHLWPWPSLSGVVLSLQPNHSILSYSYYQCNANELVVFQSSCNSQGLQLHATCTSGPIFVVFCPACRQVHLSLRLSGKKSAMHCFSLQEQHFRSSNDPRGTGSLHHLITMAFT